MKRTFLMFGLLAGLFLARGVDATLTHRGNGLIHDNVNGISWIQVCRCPGFELLGWPSERGGWLFGGTPWFREGSRRSAQEDRCHEADDPQYG